jgi:site-specific recombinase XerD
MAETVESQTITILEGSVENAITAIPNLLLTPRLEALFTTLVKSVNSHTRRAYATDARYFLNWLTEQNKTVETATFATMMSYHAHLADNCKLGLVARRFMVARRLLHMAVKLELRTANPAPVLSRLKMKPPTPC